MCLSFLNFILIQPSNFYDRISTSPRKYVSFTKKRPTCAIFLILPPILLLFSLWLITLLLCLRTKLFHLSFLVSFPTCLTAYALAAYALAAYTLAAYTLVAYVLAFYSLAAYTLAAYSLAHWQPIHW
jgi:hypothetical protein